LAKALVILPTYNEKDNLKNLVGEIISLRLPLELVIVDDNSPDGTGKIADALSCQYPQVRVIHRRGKRGRGLAGVEGFRFALKEKADYILEMDADRSHRPRYLPELLKQIKEYDCVIGSRYVSAGGERGRPFRRRAISCLANYYLRIILGNGVKDWSSGYRCFRREALASLDWNNIRSEGPSLVQEILYGLLVAGYRVKEVPIIFTEREKGSSKLGPRLLLQGLIFPLKLRWGKKQ
jgi:dolichol-phosphate mannosyltransferase